MTPEAQRIAIAELRGWKRCTPYQDIGDMTPRWYWNGGYYGEFQLPEITLDALYEVEDTLTDEQQRSYARFLAAPLCVGYDEWSIRHDFLLAHVAKTQRTEALLRTLGLWRSELGAEDIPQMWNQQ